ncbi:MAG: glucuronate isomerase [Defluviitaleaceae bacterium]|nr:glucuronate isomerase [Defluviitaleaceae bacterium]MCL2263176.1 glucuronate isomerase [Defluviitaleaceae bacterium]
MKNFMDENFLLKNETAVSLYQHIKDLPIIDYHCHLDAAAIAKNSRFRNITELWLGGDHYKWRLMRINGVPESHITGDAPDPEKFAAFCATLENAIGNPVFHWAHLELKKYFGFDGAITKENAAQIYALCNSQIEAEDFTVHGLLKKSRVEWLATTDDPADSLEFHMQIKNDNAAGVPKVLPTFRPGVIFEPQNPKFGAYVKKLGEAAGIHIHDWDSLRAALSQRLDFFAEAGCVIADHSLEDVFYLPDAKEKFIDGYRTRLLSWLGGEYHKRGWVMQLHMGAQRNNNARMKRLAGADTGFDCMSDADYSAALAKILDDMENRDALPRTILYGLNPSSDDMLAVLAACFAGRGIRGRIQWGCPWWFNDNKNGIQKHLQTLSTHGLISTFIGMLTDSRSFTAYTRHEYFRRILANQLGTWAEDGEFPHDMERLCKIAADISYFNVKDYFKV